MDSEHDINQLRYPMHTKTQARLSLLQLGRDRYLFNIIDEATYRKATTRIEDRWPQLKVTPLEF
jgi:hypothetical protein